jgi:acylphosphatase
VRAIGVKTTRHLIIHGRVQGVGYRAYMRMEADRLSVTGWVRNRADGTVEAMIHGSPEDVSKLLEWARRGPPAARVTSIEVTEASGDEYERFDQLPSTSLRR